MAGKQPKIFVMGEEQPYDQVPEADAVSIEDYFSPVILSGKAIDLASQIVPEEYWKPVGIHTWLQGRANTAFDKMKSTNDKETTVGRLRYVFEHTAEGPTLKSVRLV